MRIKIIIFIFFIFLFIFYYKNLKINQIRKKNNQYTQSQKNKDYITRKLKEKKESIFLKGKLVYIKNNNVWLLENNFPKILTNDGESPKDYFVNDSFPEIWYSFPKLSPDGKKIAVIKNHNFKPTKIVIIKIEKNEKIEFNDNISQDFPYVLWSKDSQKLFYFSPSNYNLESIILKSINIDTFETKIYGEFIFKGGCGGGSLDISDHLSASENISGLFNESATLTFQISPKEESLIYSPFCTGIGITLVKFMTNENKILNERAFNAVFSSSGKKIAAIYEKGILIFDENGNFLKTYSTEHRPQILLWDDSENFIYYSSLKLIGKIEAKVLKKQIVCKINESNLWKIDLATGKSERVFEIEARNLKPIYVDESKIIVALVENSTKLCQYFLENDKKTDNVFKLYPSVKLAEIDLLNKNLIILLNDVYQTHFLLK